MGRRYFSSRSRTVQGELSEEQEQALLEPSSSRHHQSVLKWLRDRDYWLECQCRENACLFIRRSGGGQHHSLYVQGNNEIQRHRKGCRYLPKKRYTGTDVAPPDFVDEPTDLDFFGDGEKGGNQPPNDGGNGGNGSDGQREPKLYRVMKQISHIAQTDRIVINDDPWESRQRDAVTNAAAELTIRGKPLNEAIFFFPDWKLMKATLKEKGWRSDKGEILLWWLVSEYVTNDDGHIEIYVKFPGDNNFHWQTLYNTNVLIHHHRGARTGAFLFGGVAQLTENGGTTIPKGYLVPIVSFNQWCMVDSNYEREAINAARDAIKKRKDSEIVLEKPLYPLDANNGKKVLPDLLFSKGGNKAIMEVMGSNNPNYLDGKETQIAAMKTIATVIKADVYNRPNEADSDRRKRYLFVKARECIDSLQDNKP
jgi:hypothetical protein